ncbi:MAG TPA: CHAD domain-containing protein [Caldilineaceae bacterium]|nr:CHAD domain-containing protein [Caldilineaceae bacterium]
MASEDQHEQEVKFAIASPAQCDALVSAPSISPAYLLSPPETVQQTDTYYDTPAFALLRAGFALRVREVGDQAIVGLKSLPAGSGLVHKRLELETPIAQDGAPVGEALWLQLPARIKKLTGELDRLMPVVVLRQQRHKRRAAAASAPGAVLAEVSIDQVDVFTPGAELHPCPQPVASFDEIEVELLDPAAAQALDDLAQRLRGEHGLEPLQTSKLERAITAVHAHTPGGPPGQTGLTAAMDVAAACRLLLRDQLALMLLAEPRIRAGAGPDPVHQMRVAVRRARAAGRLFDGYFRPRELRPHLRGLKRLGKALGPVRDLDVALQNLRRFRKQLPKDKRKGIKALQQELEQRRETARQSLLAYLKSQEHAFFIEQLEEFCRIPGAEAQPDPGEGPEVAARQVRHVLPGLILTRFGHVRAYETLFERSEPPSLASLHRLRIECKYLRYSLEFVRHLLGEPVEPLIEQLKGLQDDLGALNDADVERARLESWRRYLHDNPALATRLAQLDETIAGLSAAVPARFAQFVGPPSRARLAEALAHL